MDLKVQYTPLEPQFWSDLAQGMKLANEAIMKCVSLPQVHKIYKKDAKWLALVFVAVLAAIFSVMLPVKLVLRLLSFVMDVTEMQAGLSVWSIFVQCSLLVPTIVGTLITAMLPSHSEGIFFAVYDHINKQRSVALQKASVAEWQRSLYKLVARLARVWGLFSAIALLSLVPYLGYLILPAASFFVLHRRYGTSLAAAVAAISLVPFLRPLSLGFLKVWVGTSVLYSDLMEPYFRRLQSPEEEIYVKRRYYSLLMGFALPFTIVMAIPVIGVFLWTLSMATCPFLLERILTQDDRLREKVPANQ